MNKPELLLPAGKWESLCAAVAAGANAVYLAGSDYGARAQAGNFDREQMEKAVKLCHRHGVRVYVTMNTLLADDELAAALSYAKFLYDLGADALIVQDLGLAACLRKLLPALPLHASTQLTVHNVRTARFARDFGFCRAILARETTLQEIAAIRAAVPDLELEVFCHGALCISYSGQCLMSSMIGGRSGNRGRCAQPCRLPYTLIDGFGRPVGDKPAPLLSTRDLNTLELLPELAAAGVVSLKVEGRMRRPEYVATVGRVYRAALDRLQEGDFFVRADEHRDVQQVYSRDFTAGYFGGNPGAALMSGDRTSNRGRALGRVKAVKGKRVSVELTDDLQVGDGIEIWVKVGGRCGVTVSTLWLRGNEADHAYAGQTVELMAEGHIRPGDRVFKTYDAALMTQAMEPARALADALPLTFTVTARAGEELTVTAADAHGHEAAVRTGYLPEIADSRPADAAFVQKQLGRLGGSGYRLQALDLRLEGELVIPASVLNQARRELVAALDAQRATVYPPVTAHHFAQNCAELLPLPREKKKRNVPLLAVKVRDLPQLQAALDAGAELVCFAPHLTRTPLSARDRDILSELLSSQNDALLYALPALCPQQFAAAQARSIEEAQSLGFRHFLAGQSGDIFLKEQGAATVWADHTLSVFNGQTARALYDKGFDGVTCSLELPREELAFLANTVGAKEVVVHGAVPMMVSRHCVVGAALGSDKNRVPCGFACDQQRFHLQDRLNMRFPLLTDAYHLAHIYNCKDLALIDELSALLNFDRWRIEGQLYDIGSLKEVIALYREAREQAVAGGSYQKKQLFDELKRYHEAGFTKGHYIRKETSRS